MAYQSPYADAGINPRLSLPSGRAYLQALPWAFGSCGINFASGALVKGVEEKVADWLPDHPYAPTIGSAIVIVGLKAFAASYGQGLQGRASVNDVLWELCSGAAGGIGADVWQAIERWWHRKTWEKAKTYAKGDHVSHDGKVWEAQKDVLAGVEPGKDETAWTKVVHKSQAEEGKRGQGFEADIPAMAKAFLKDDKRSQAIVFDVATLLGDRGHFTTEEAKKKFIEACEEVLKGVIQQFATV